MPRKRREKQEPEYIVRRATPADLIFIANMNASTFEGSNRNVQNALSWARGLYKSAPLYQYFVIADKANEDKPLGYAGWMLHGGFERIEPIFELDQITIAAEARRGGIGGTLIRECISRIAPWLADMSPRCAEIVSVVVWGYEDNPPAVRLYKKIFTDGVRGERTQFEERKELMWRLRVRVKDNNVVW